MKYYRLAESWGIKQNNEGNFEIIVFGDLSCECCAERSNCTSQNSELECRFGHLSFYEFYSLQAALLKYSDLRLHEWENRIHWGANASERVYRVADEVLSAEKAWKEGEWKS